MPLAGRGRRAVSKQPRRKVAAIEGIAGAGRIDRTDFLQWLEKNEEETTMVGKWKME